ncbi:MAG: archease [Candidatus Zixiibacteriota bacterium]
MPFKITDKYCPGDVGLTVSANSLENLFIDSGLGLMNIMTDLEIVRKTKQININVKEDSLEDLYYAFLSELIYIKDADNFLFSGIELKIDCPEEFHLNATIFGENIERDRHTLKTDIKAVTYYRFRIEEVEDRWESEVIFDL